MYYNGEYALKDYFNFLGFKINTKKFLMATGVYALIVFILVLIDLLFLEVSWYGFLMGSAFLLAVVVSSELMPLRGLKKDLPYDLIWRIFPLSIIGARLAFVANFPDQYKTFYDVIAVWNGGLSIYGGVIGGAVGLVICCLIKKVNPICAMDCVVPVLILGQAIGRWGNFFNVEVYGLEITNKALQWFPFGIKNEYGVWHLATFFYESMLNLIGFFILLLLVRKTKQKGLVASVYLMYYGFIRFFLEGIRESKFIMYIPGTQIAWSALVSIIMFAIGVGGFIASLIVYRVKRRANNNSETTNNL